MKRILFPNRFHWMLVPATDTMIKLFNQSIRRLRLTKTKSLIFASLLVGALVTLLSVPLQAAGPSPLDSGGQPADTFSILLSGKYKTVPAKPMVDCPNIGLYVCDGTLSTTKIYLISGFREKTVDRAIVAIPAAKRRTRSATFTCSSLVPISLPTTSRGAR